MTTKLDAICDCISELNINHKEGQDLMDRMNEWKNHYPNSTTRLLRVPGFRKLWDALEEMCEVATGYGLEDDDFAIGPACSVVAPGGSVQANVTIGCNPDDANNKMPKPGEIGLSAMSVREYFTMKLGVTPGDDTLSELKVMTNCGDDCRKMIDQAANLLATIDEAGISHGERLAIIKAVDHGITIFWRG